MKQNVYSFIKPSEMSLNLSLYEMIKRVFTYCVEFNILCKYTKLRYSDNFTEDI